MDAACPRCGTARVRRTVQLDPEPTDSPQTTAVLHSLYAFGLPRGTTMTAWDCPPCQQVDVVFTPHPACPRCDAPQQRLAFTLDADPTDPAQVALVARLETGGILQAIGVPLGTAVTGWACPPCGRVALTFAPAGSLALRFPADA